MRKLYLENAIILQARLGSTRFPKKIFKKILNKTILEYLINRLKISKLTKKIIVATTTKKIDLPIVKLCRRMKIDCFRGSEKDVLKRYFDCAKKYNVKNIIRITSDCPLVDPFLIDKMYLIFKKKKIDYLSNTTPIYKSQFPNGMDIEIFNFESLKKANSTVKSVKYREHVTNQFWGDLKYKSCIYGIKRNLSNLRITLDYPSDLVLIKKIILRFRNRYSYRLNDILKYLRYKN